MKSVLLTGSWSCWRRFVNFSDERWNFYFKRLFW